MTERNDATTRRGGWTQWTPAQARRALAAWRSSGLPLATFARKRGIGPCRLRWWRKRLGAQAAAAKTPAAAPRLVPAIVTAPLLSLSAAPVSVRVPGGAVLEIADVRAVPPEWVGILMAAAARTSR